MRIGSSRLAFVVALFAMVAVSCTGGARPEFDGSASASAAPTATQSAAPDADDEVVTAESEGVDSTSSDNADPATPVPASEESSETEEIEPVATPDPGLSEEVDALDPSDYARQGTVSVSLDDGRSFVGAVGCETRTGADQWLFRFGGFTEAGVQIEGAYDTSQADFVILFISGPAAGSGSGVPLSNINGADDLIETNSGGFVWIASITLWTPEGEPVVARVEANCG